MSELMSLHRAHLARQAKFNAAAKRYEASKPPPPQPQPPPRPQIEIPVAQAVPVIEKNIFPPDTTPIGLIKRAVCTRFDITLEEMDGSNRSPRLARPRQIAMYLAKTMTDQSLNGIARRFGNRHHSTVLHAARKITGEIPHNAELRELIEALDGEARPQ